MAITANATVVQAVPKNSAPWAVSVYSADASGTELVKAAVANKSLYVTKLVISCLSTITVSILGGSTVYLGPIYGPALTLDFSRRGMATRGLKLPVGVALNVDTSGACAVHVYAEGYAGYYEGDVG